MVYPGIQFNQSSKYWACAHTVGCKSNASGPGVFWYLYSNLGDSLYEGHVDLWCVHSKLTSPYRFKIINKTWTAWSGNSQGLYRPHTTTYDVCAQLYHFGVCQTPYIPTRVPCSTHAGHVRHWYGPENKHMIIRKFLPTLCRSCADLWVHLAFMWVPYNIIRIDVYMYITRVVTQYISYYKVHFTKVLCFV